LHWLLDFKYLAKPFDYYTLQEKALSMNYQMIGPQGRQIWTKLFHTPLPKNGLVIVGTGSGEVRSVDDDNHEEICGWLNSLGWDAVVYDKYGCGESDGDWKNVTFDLLRDDLVILAEFFKAKVSKKLVILGQCESSILAAEAAEKCTDIDALVLKVASHQDISDRIKMQLGIEKWTQWLKEMELADQTGRKFAASHPVTYFKSRMGRVLTGDVIRMLKIPILALNGSSDTFTPQQAFQSIHDSLKEAGNSHSRAVIIENAGHSLMLASETWSCSIAANEIKDFLNSIL